MKDKSHKTNKKRIKKTQEGVKEQEGETLGDEDSPEEDEEDEQITSENSHQTTQEEFEKQQ